MRMCHGSWFDVKNFILQRLTATEIKLSLSRLCMGWMLYVRSNSNAKPKATINRLCCRRSPPPPTQLNFLISLSFVTRFNNRTKISQIPLSGSTRLHNEPWICAEFPIFVLSREKRVRDLFWCLSVVVVVCLFYQIFGWHDELKRDFD